MIMRLHVSVVSALSLVAAVALSGKSALAFHTTSSISRRNAFSLASTAAGSDDDAFASFAATLEPVKTSNGAKGGPQETWKNDLDDLLNPMTTQARRQILLSQLLTANGDIRASVEAALRDRKIDPLLTPTGKKWQDGTRAVARQLTSDILPGLRSTSGGRPTPFSTILSPPPRPQDLTKAGSRVLTFLQKNFQENLETLQTDLRDPTRIPARVQQQTESLVKEAQNVFSETPAGLKEPAYTTVMVEKDYEIRDYEGYTVATTNMAAADEIYNLDNVGQAGQAFNSLASYLFGANAENKAMEMTTPVQTTMTGEMRFYLATDTSIPDPLGEDEGTNMYETGNKILIQQMPPCRLAVRRFTGFCTAGEIARQKESLLAALEFDNVALDVAHGQTVGHVTFQYNPPYTLPVIRRNEIAVPVVNELLASAVSNSKDEWTVPGDDELPGTD